MGFPHVQEAKSCDNSGSVIVRGFREGLLDPPLINLV